MGGSKKRLYLDYNASAPLLSQARDIIIAALDVTGNPSSVHSEGRTTKAIMETARRQVAKLVNARADHVFFTSGATEAASTLLSPTYMMGRAPVRMSKVYVSATEHPSILAGGQFLPENIVILPVHQTGILDIESLRQNLSVHNNTQGLPLVAVQYANNETGVVQPIAEIAAVVKAAGGVLVVDCVQAAGRVPLDITNNCGDYFILSSHKIGGAKGVGAIVAVSDLLMPKALIRGGGQEKGHRAGTEALPLIAGFGAAAHQAYQRILNGGWSSHLRDEMERRISEVAPSTLIYGAKVERLPNTSFFSLKNMKAETVQIAFDLDGIAVSAGSACSSGKVGPSHVIVAMGYEHGTGAIRVSLSPDTNGEDIDRFIQVLHGIVGRQRCVNEKYNISA